MLTGLPTLKVAAELRAGGIPVELYPDPIRLDKQLKYADAQGIKIAVIIGPTKRKREGDDQRFGKESPDHCESGRNGGKIGELL